MYGTGKLTFDLKVTKHLGKTKDNLNLYEAKYMRVRRGRACRGELEQFTQGDILEYLLDASGQRELLLATDAGKLLARLTSYSYLKTLAFWVDVTLEGKVVSKLFQKSGVLLSDVTSGVEDSISSITELKKKPGSFMVGFNKDYDNINESLYGFALTSVEEGEESYQLMLSNTTQSLAAHMNERFTGIINNPVLKAACTFEHIRWPSATEELEAHGNEDIETLLKHFKVLFDYLGGDASKVQREWRRLKLYVSKPENNHMGLSYQELYERLFDHKSDKTNGQHYYNVLLLVTIVMCIAVDTSICERGFSLMNNLKTARRSRMGNELLRILMTICSLGSEWADPSKIPVDEIIEQWRSQSERGRYEAAMWQEAGLEEAATNWTSGAAGRSGRRSNSDGNGGDGNDEDNTGEVDNLAAGGFFAYYGRPGTQQSRGEHAGTHTNTRMA